MTVVWKIPERWRTVNLTDRAALYPALYLRWAGTPVQISSHPPVGRWNRAQLRVLVTEGALAPDERDLLVRTEARSGRLLHLPLGGSSLTDRSLLQDFDLPTAAFVDDGPLTSLPPCRSGRRLHAITGCAARSAEDLLLLTELARPPEPPSEPANGPPPLVAAVESQAALQDILPMLRRTAARLGAEIIVTSEDEEALAQIGRSASVRTIGAADAGLLAVIAKAQVFLCAYPLAPAHSPRPGHWARSALYQGAPVIAASHPSLDGLAHLCVLDDWERGLALYTRFPTVRLRAVVEAQAALAPRLAPERIAAEWRGLIDSLPEPKVRRGLRPFRSVAPLVLTLIDLQQDLDILLPILLALRARGEARLRIIMTDWLVAQSPRASSQLKAHALPFEVAARGPAREGSEPSLRGVSAVLSASDSSVNNHKAGYALCRRAREMGLLTFSVQHGLENIGLNYRDDVHEANVRFASATVFTWCRNEDLAPWVPQETRVAATPVGSPKASPVLAPVELSQGHWSRIVGVFENLHWRRFSDVFRQQLLDDLHLAAETHPDTLFLIKPHHAGQWASTNPGAIRQSANLVVIDPTDSAWEPHTAPALISAMDAVLTTPSTVAVDAAGLGRPVAVFGYDLDLPIYAPLPIIRRFADLQDFLDDGDAGLLRNEEFLKRVRLPGRADHRIAAHIGAALLEHPPRRDLAGSVVRTIDFARFVSRWRRN